MLKFEAITLRRGPRVLIADASFSIFRGEKAGITGENGSGKSSLMSLVRGELQPDAGTFEMPGNLEIAHVSQELDATDQHAIEFVLDGDAPLRSIERQIADAEARDAGEKLGELYAMYAAAGGYDAPFWATSGQSDPPTGEPPVEPPVTNPPPLPTPSTPAPSAPVRGGQGDSCASTADCQGGFGCYQPNSTSVPFCVERCDSEADCGGTLTCASVGDGSGEATVCLERRADPSGLGEAGAPGEPPSDSTTSDAGCAVAPRSNPSSPAGVVAALGVALALTFRRRRTH